MTTVDDIFRIAQTAITRGDSSRAIQAYQDLVETFPENKKAIWQAANQLRASDLLREAIAILETGLKHHPESIALLNLAAEIHLQNDSPSCALPYLRRVAELLPDQTASWRNIEAARSQIEQKTDENRGLAPVTAAMLNLAFSADQMQRYEEARANYEAVLEQDPANLLALARLLTFDGIEGRLSDADKRHQRLVDSISLSDLDSVNWQHLGAIAYHNVTRQLPLDLYQEVMGAIDRQLSHFANTHKVFSPPKAPRKDERRRVGYLSSYFRDHPIGHVMADFFSAHDRSRFDVYVFYSPSGPHAEYTKKIQKGVEHFITLSGIADEMALAIAAHDLDILVYIDGVMCLPLLPVMALRPAPTQIFWLGHAGACEFSFIDYVIADANVIPPDESKDYSTEIIRLPETYHCASHHPITPEMSRENAALPEKGFVFCAFNNPEKIDSKIFDSWMRILRSVDKSVLWLSRTLSPLVEKNLREAASLRGVNEERLIFAERIPNKAVHLSRHKLAGLFLDTITLNASTTALDSLWAGLPVLTVRGSRFSSRIAASHLHAVGLDDMVSPSLLDYERRAIHLATHPNELNEIRKRLTSNLETHPLFQIRRFCANFEKGLEKAYESRPRRI